ncbi:MAG: ABC transporter permease [Clostridiales Family XIII bacterium]|jgi:ABC-2 type transport system permease protein|nr:ABC transporter permease [Clostridiales Family XIII bacterium]
MNTAVARDAGNVAKTKEEVLEKIEVMKSNIAEAGVKKGKSKIAREANAILTIIARDVLLGLKSPGMLVMYFGMPLIMMGMIGGNLAQNMAGGLGFEFGTFMLVGMLINMLFMVTSMGLTSLVDDHETDFTQEMMISPVSRYSIVIGKILGSAFGGILSMIGTCIVGLFMGYTLTLSQWLAILALSPLICLSAGALAMIIFGVIKSNKLANLAAMLIVMPQMFLSGAIIPIANSTGILYVLSRCMPMTYCLDLVRSVVYAGSPEYDSIVLFNPVLNCVVIVGLTAVCLAVGTYLFARSEKDR